MAAAVDQLWGVVERATSRHFSLHDRARIYFRRFSKNYSGNILNFGITKLFPYYARHNFRTPSFRTRIPPPTFHTRMRVRRKIRLLSTRFVRPGIRIFLSICAHYHSKRSFYSCVFPRMIYPQTNVIILTFGKNNKQGESSTSLPYH